MIAGCSVSEREIKPLKTYYTQCNIAEINLFGHDYYDIVEVWGSPTDTLYADKKLPKHKGSNDSWYYVAYSWSDTSKVKVEGKLSIKLIFEAELENNGYYKPIKGNNGISPNCSCYPLNESAY